MRTDNTYKIDFHSLKAGQEGGYTYDFPIDDRFFERWPESEITRGTGHAVVRLVRHASMMELTVTIDAEVLLTCDRCLDEFMCPVHFEGHPVVKISDQIPPDEQYSGDAHEAANNSDGDILWISPAEESLDLGQYIYESIMLSLPFQRVHPDAKECNQEMLRRFKIVTEEEFDELTHTAPDGTESETNPFAALADLKKDDK